MKKYSIIIFLSIIFFSCCKKKPYERFIPADLKAYWDFKPGTYWIYQDSITGAIDSVYVTKRTNYTGEGTLNYNGDKIIYEFLQIDKHSSLDGYDYQYWINTQAGDKDVKEANVVFSNKSKPGDYHSNKCFVYPLIIGTATYVGYGGGPSNFDTCFIKNILSNFFGFENVIEIENTFNEFEHFKHSFSYYSKYIGLIRYEVPDSNENKKLINYYINP